MIALTNAAQIERACRLVAKIESDARRFAETHSETHAVLFAVGANLTDLAGLCGLPETAQIEQVADAAVAMVKATKPELTRILEGLPAKLNAISALISDEAA